MKIVILADAWQPVIGGGQKLFLQLIKGLVKDHSCQIHVITRSLKDSKGRVFNKNESLLNSKLIITRLGTPTKWSNLLSRILFIFQSAFYALKLNPDVYLASTFLPAFSLKIIKIFNKTPNALVVIGFGAVNKLYILLEKFITQKLKFDLLITDDFNYYQKVKSKKNIKFIPNGVTVPKKINLDKYKDFTFLFVGRNEPRKGVHILRPAFESLKKTYPKVKLKLIGPGFKTISQKQLDQELFKAHCLVLPSLREGHPLILFEAWAHKLPVIATKVGSLPRFITPDNGYLILPKNPTSLTQAMEKAIKNKSLKTLGSNGFNLVKKKYTWSKTVKKYYQSLTNLQGGTLKVKYPKPAL